MKRVGRPPKYTAAQIRAWRKQVNSGERTVTDLAREWGKNKGTVHQTLFGKGRYTWVK